MIKAVLWDMDGVLIDSEEMHYQIEAQTLQEFGIAATSELTKQYSGEFIDAEFTDILKRFNREDIKLDQLLAARERLLDAKIQSGIPAAPNVEQVLIQVGSSYLIALVTSGERVYAENVLSKLNLLKYFKVKIFGEDVINSKPDPEPYLKAAQQLEIIPKECVVVEDSLNGFKAAKGAGMLLIARKAHHNNHIDFSLADYVVEDLLQIPGILKNIS